MSFIEKTCPVCGNKFVVDKSVAERDLCCTLGCCLKSMGRDGPNVIRNNNFVSV